VIHVRVRLRPVGSACTGESLIFRVELFWFLLFGPDGPTTHVPHVVTFDFISAAVPLLKRVTVKVALYTSGKILHRLTFATLRV
jgi:hypothetical protein